MAKKLFIGGLSWNTTAEHLREAFEEFGDISDAIVISDKSTGRSKGFGFITFNNDGDADNAIAEGNGAELEGRTLTVSEAKALKPKNARR